MKKAKILSLVISACAVLASSPTRAADGVALLKNEHGARSAGMGTTMFSQGKDPNTVAHNPALAAGFPKFAASFGHTEFWEDIRFESGFFAADMTSKLSLHGGIRYATIDNLEWRTSPTAIPLSVSQAHDISFKGGFAYRLTPKIDVGLAAGWIIEKIGGYRGSAFNLDFGTIVHLEPNLDLGAAVTNLGSEFNLELAGLPGSDNISLPTAYRVGAAYKYQRYLGAVEIVYSDDEAHLHLGAEAKITEIFSLRSGYMLNYSAKNFTAGASFAHRNITVDYAFIPFSQNLGTSHLFNLTFTL